jgi:hypothetical protein
VKLNLRHSDNAGTELWRQYQDVLRAASAADQPGTLPTGASKVTATPAGGELSQLPPEWQKEAAHASHVIYHYGTPIAWIDVRDNVWVVPPEKYSPGTTGAQNRIRDRLGNTPYRTAPVG